MAKDIMSPEIVVVTGASGFVGRYLVDHLLDCGYSVIGLSSQLPTLSHPRYKHLNFTKLNDRSRYSLFQNVTYFVHLAAAAHFCSPYSSPPRTHSAFSLNVSLLKQYFPYFNVKSLRRVVLVSSLGVLSDPKSITLTSASSPAPSNIYSQSKFACELLLQNYCLLSNIDWVIFRPPLIYGPQAPGNFKSLFKLIRYSPFFIFTGLNNKRSFLSIFNFVSAIEASISAPDCLRSTFLISDMNDISLSMLERLISIRLSSRKLSFPLPFYRLLYKFLSPFGFWKKLSCSLCIRSSDFSESTGWYPPYTPEQSINKF